MIKIKVNEDRCQNCSVCLAECIHNKKYEDTDHVDHSYLFCNRCLHCYAVCPNNAIEVEEGFTGKDISSNGVSYDDLLFLLQKRRSVRYFQDKPIEEDDLLNVLESTRYIPSGGNNQDISITLLKNEEKKKMLRKEVINYYRKMNKISKNRVIRFVASVFGSPKVKEGLQDKLFIKKINDMNEKLKTRDLVFYNAPLVMIIHTSRMLPTAKEDAILAAYNIILSAETLGLSSCFVSLSQQAMNSKNRCKKIVDIDQNDTIHAVVVLGYPVRQYKRTVFRDIKNINEI